MRVAAFLNPRQRADVDCVDASGLGRRGCPGVVSRAVDDGDVRRRDARDVGGCRFVVVGIGRGVGDRRRHRDMFAAERLGHRAPLADRRGDVQRVVIGGSGRRGASGERGGRQCGDQHRADAAGMAAEGAGVAER